MKQFHFQKEHGFMIGAAVFAALFLFAAIMLCREYSDQKQSADAFSDIVAMVRTEPALEAVPEEHQNIVAEIAPEETHPEMTAYEKYAAVYEQNHDFVGWVSIDDTNINYPVVQSPDEPNFYLKHAFDRSYSDYGVPYPGLLIKKPKQTILTSALATYGMALKSSWTSLGLFSFPNQLKTWVQYEK